MPLPLETSFETPNALYAPQIVLNTYLAEGQVKTMAVITIKPAKCDENGVWSETGNEATTVVINDVFNLDADIASLQDSVNQVFGGIVQLIGAINAIRKIK